MFENLGWWEILCLLLLALFIIGPERLPKVAGDAARFLHRLRTMARNAGDELREHTGMDIDELADLHPKRFVRRHLLSEEDEQALRRPWRSNVEQIETELERLRRDTDFYPGRPALERRNSTVSGSETPTPTTSPRIDPEAT